jgi:hypothetical protein
LFFLAKKEPKSLVKKNSFFLSLFEPLGSSQRMLKQSFDGHPPIRVHDYGKLFWEGITGNVTFG